MSKQDAPQEGVQYWLSAITAPLGETREAPAPLRRGTREAPAAVRVECESATGHGSRAERSSLARRPPRSHSPMQEADACSPATAPPGNAIVSDTPRD